MTRPFRHAMMALMGLSILILLVQLGSGIWLFVHTLSLDPHMIAITYRGDMDAFIASRSITAILQVSMVHLLGMGMVAFVLLHWLPYCSIRSFWSVLLGAMMVSGIVLGSVAPLLIVWISPLFGWVKLVAFLLFELGMMIAMMIIIYTLITQGTQS